MLAQSYGGKTKSIMVLFLEKKCELHRNEKLEPLSRSTGKASGTFLSEQSMDKSNDQAKHNRNSNG